MINFLLPKWVPSWGLIKKKFFTFLPITLNSAYFAPLNGASRIFPVNFNYQRCLENSNMINFWLTSLVPSWGQIFVSFVSLFLFFTRHFEFSLLCTPKWCGSDFSSKLQLTKMPGKLVQDQYLVDKLGPFLGTDLFSFFLLHFFTYLPVTLNIAYFAPLNGAGQIFPITFNYHFWLTSWVFSWNRFFLVFSLFAPDKSVQQTTPKNARPKYCFDNPVTFSETRGKKWLISGPRFVYRSF